MLTVLLGLIWSGSLARLLSIEEMGGYFLAFNLAGFFSIFCRFGAESTVLRFISESVERQESGRVRKIIIKSLSLLLCTTVIVGLMCQHFSGHKVTQIYDGFRSLPVINNHWWNEAVSGCRTPQYIQIFPV
ncbi:oligosaccharide flippase family protein [Thiolapillus sp.]|uniref:oligosaccharide flippase family protein n=1 Tax=Thiolapillus sp. TaxID=2017437 RepID=UPI003AF8D277